MTFVHVYIGTIPVDTFEYDRRFDWDACEKGPKRRVVQGVGKKPGRTVRVAYRGFLVTFVHGDIGPITVYFFLDSTRFRLRKNDPNFDGKNYNKIQSLPV